MFVSHRSNVRVNRNGALTRRDVLARVGFSAMASSMLPWTRVLEANQDELKRRGMACILLWMQGGPSQMETLDPKQGHANGGETKAIETKVPGTRISENLPKLAALADQFSIIRSVSTKEGEHQRASFLMHTSYVPNPTVEHPAMGAAVSHELQNLESKLPGFVRVNSQNRNLGNGGFLGANFNAFSVRAGQPPVFSKIGTSVNQYNRRLDLLDKLEVAAGTAAANTRSDDHRKLYRKTSSMILSPSMEAFDLANEPQEAKDAYGNSEFGMGCLLARRLIESGVTFVEVGLGNWDTHVDNFAQSKRLCESLDQPFAHLLTDLKQRGLLDTTLVIWMGEFGRTPRINPRAGRDHFPRAFSVAVAGAKVKPGQVIGTTAAAGDEVKDRPVSTQDLFQTYYRALGLDPATQNMSPIGRPISLVEGGKPVTEVLA